MTFAGAPLRVYLAFVPIPDGGGDALALIALYDDRRDRGARPARRRAPALRDLRAESEPRLERRYPRTARELPALPSHQRR